MTGCVRVCAQVVASVCAALCSLGASAICAELSQLPGPLQDSAKVLCDDLLKKAGEGRISIDFATEQLVMDVVRYVTACRRSHRVLCLGHGSLCRDVLYGSLMG